MFKGRKSYNNYIRGSFKNSAKKAMNSRFTIYIREGGHTGAFAQHLNKNKCSLRRSKKLVAVPLRLWEGDGELTSSPAAVTQ